MARIDPSITFKLPQEEKEKLNKLAHNEYRSVTSWLRAVIQREYERIFPTKKEGEK